MATETELPGLLERIERYWPRAGAFTASERVDWMRTLREFEGETVENAIDICAEEKPRFRPDLPELRAACRRIEPSEIAPRANGHKPNCTCGRCHYGPVWDAMRTYGGWLDSGGNLHRRDGEVMTVPSSEELASAETVKTWTDASRRQLHEFGAKGVGKRVDDVIDPIEEQELVLPSMYDETDPVGFG